MLALRERSLNKLWRIGSVGVRREILNECKWGFFTNYSGDRLVRIDA
jgi:hypothetical protein